MTPEIMILDIETTGLDIDSCQVLEIAALSITKEGEVVGKFQVRVKYDQLIGEPYALTMNKDLIANMRSATPFKYAQCDLLSWVEEEFTDNDVRPYVAGFNVGTFDIAFLVAKGFLRKDSVHHRTIDLGSALMGRRGSATPISSREFTNNEVAHSAMADCMMALAAYRECIGGYWNITGEEIKALSYPKLGPGSIQKTKHKCPGAHGCAAAECDNL